MQQAQESSLGHNQTARENGGLLEGDCSRPREGGEGNGGNDQKHTFCACIQFFKNKAILFKRGEELERRLGC